MQKKVLEYLDNHKEELYNLLSELLKIDTQNYISYGKEEPGQRYFEEYCKKFGFETDFYYPDDIPGFTEHEGYLAGRGTDKRPNVTAILRGKEGKRKVTIAAHMDTMPVGSEDKWSVPGLGGVIRDNKIWGRGSSDDKFGIAAGILALRAIKECNITLNDDVYVTSYVDEEYGGGNGALASCVKYPSDVYINLDGGSMEVWPWGIGGCSCRASLHNPNTSSSAITTFEGLKIMVEEFENFGKKRFAELHNNPVFKDTDIEHDAYRLLGLKCGDQGLDLDKASISFTYYTLSSKKEMDAEINELTEKIKARLEPLGLIYNGMENVSRFFHPVYSENLADDVLTYGKVFEQAKGSGVKYAGGCLSDLSVFANYGGGVAFNTGLFKGFGEYGGPHQIDEHVDCDEFLAITKALALYLLETNK